MTGLLATPQEGSAGRVTPFPVEWGDAVRRLVDWARSPDGCSLLLLDGLTAAGRREFVGLAEREWAEQGLTVLVGTAPMPPGDVVPAAVYDAVIGAPQWPVPQVPAWFAGSACEDGTVPGDVVAQTDLPERAGRAWADVVRRSAGPRPFVLVLHEVDARPEAAAVFLRTLAGTLRTAVPHGRVVVNPIVALPPGMTDVLTLTCPASPPPGRLPESVGAYRLHPEITRTLKRVSDDRRVLQDVLQAWVREGRIALVDGVWMPGEDLTVPPAPTFRPAVGQLRSLAERQSLVLAATGLLGPVGVAGLEAAIGPPERRDESAEVRECLDELGARGLVVPGDGGFVVADPVLRAAVAASIGPARRALWQERAARAPGDPVAGGGAARDRATGRRPARRPPSGALRTATGQQDGWRVAGPDLMQIRGDGEEVIAAARRGALRSGPEEWRWAGLAAVVLARRGRLDRARTWLQLARRAGGDGAAAMAWWAEAEIRRLEGRRDLALQAGRRAVREAERAADDGGGRTRRDDLGVLARVLAAECRSLVEEGPAGPPGLVPGVPRRSLSAEQDYLSAVRLMRTTIQSVAAGQTAPQRLGEVLEAARSRRCLVEWCRAARLARTRGLAPGRLPGGPDGLDDVQRALLSLLAAGLTTRGCAEALSMHPRAVEYRIRALFELTGAASRAQLVRAYADGGVVDLSV